MTTLSSGLRVAALIRRANQAGGFAAVLRRGDADAGAILVVTNDRGTAGPILERGLTGDGRVALIATGPTATDSVRRDAWLERRWRDDPDLWIVELDIADAERFAAETILDD